MREEQKGRVTLPHLKRGKEKVKIAFFLSERKQTAWIMTQMSIGFQQ